MDCERELGQDVLVSKVGFLKGFGAEFAVFVGGHESWGEAERAEGERALGRARYVVDQSYAALIQLLLVVVDVFDEVHVDEVAQVGGGVEAGVVGVDVDFAEFLDHVDLVDGVGFGARSGAGEGGDGGRVMVGVGLRDVDCGEREGVGGLELGGDVHADEEAGCRRGEGLGAVFDYLHDHLYVFSAGDHFLLWSEPVPAPRPGRSSAAFLSYMAISWVRR